MSEVYEDDFLKSSGGVHLSQSHEKVKKDIVVAADDLRKFNSPISSSH
jgi:hypothetical protein